VENTMAITNEKLCEFVSEHGPVSIVDPRGTTNRLEANNANVPGVLESAERVFYEGQWYSRQEFEQIVEDRLTDYCGY
jgi:hypothetical protein